MRRTRGEASTSSEETVRRSSAPRPVTAAASVSSDGGTFGTRGATPSAAATRRTSSGVATASPSDASHAPPTGSGASTSADDRMHEVADVEEIAPVRNAAERQQRFARDGVEQRSEIALDARPVDEREPQHDRVERRSRRDRRQRALGLHLAARIRIVRRKRVVGPERAARHCRLAVDLDRAREHEPPHARPHRGRREALRRDDVRRLVEGAWIGRGIGQHVRPAREMHDRRGAGDELFESGFGCRREVAHRAMVRFRSGAGRMPANRRDERPAGRDELCDQRAADETRRHR